MSAGAPTTTAPVAAPPGGFQNGGWYGGEEYNASNNTFGAPGVINNPNQVGYGAAVSAPVNLQSDAAQGKAPGTIQNFLAGPAAANPGQQGGTTGNATTPTGSATPTSPDITASQGKISDIRNQITTRQQAASDAIAQINDNPFYSEATRVGKIAKVNENLNADLAPLSQQLTSEQANYDALVKAATPNTEVVQSTDDNGNLTLLTVNKDTGAILSSQSVPGVGKAKAASATDTKDQTTNQNMTNAIGDIKHGATLQQVVDHYGVAGGLTVDQIYQLYNENSPRGTAKETLTQVKQGQYATQKGFVQTKV